MNDKGINNVPFQSLLNLPSSFNLVECGGSNCESKKSPTNCL